MNRKYFLLMTLSLIQFSSISHADDFDPTDPLGEKVQEARGYIRRNTQKNLQNPESQTYAPRTFASVENQYKTIIENSNTLVKEAKDAHKSAENDLNKFQSEEFKKTKLAANQSWWSSLGGKVGSFFGTDQNPEDIKKAKADEIALDKAQKDLDKKISDIKKKKNQIDFEELSLEKLKNEKTQRVLSLDKEVNLLRKHLERNEAFQDLRDLKMEFLDAQDQLDIIEKQLDRSAVGNYLQVKLGKFMNSRSFCSAAKQCSGGNKKEKADVPQIDFTNEIFGNRTIGPNDQNINDAIR